jgi:hypothetical protein
VARGGIYRREKPLQERQGRKFLRSALLPRQKILDFAASLRSNGAYSDHVPVLTARQKPKAHENLGKTALKSNVFAREFNRLT